MHAIRKTIATAAVAFAALASALTPATSYAVSAFLVRCDTGTSVTGRFIYIGTYQYGGQTFQYTFTSYCPNSIDIQ